MCDSHSTHGHHHAETVPKLALEVEAQQQVDEAAQEELLVGQAREEVITLDLELRQGRDFERSLNQKISQTLHK